MLFRSSTLESEIENSLNSKVLKKSHDKIFDELIKKYDLFHRLGIEEFRRTADIVHTEYAPFDNK